MIFLRNLACSCSGDASMPNRSSGLRVRQLAASVLSRQTSSRSRIAVRSQECRSLPPRRESLASSPLAKRGAGPAHAFDDFSRECRFACCRHRRCPGKRDGWRRTETGCKINIGLQAGKDGVDRRRCCDLLQATRSFLMFGGTIVSSVEDVRSRRSVSTSRGYPGLTKKRDPACGDACLDTARLGFDEQDQLSHESFHTRNDPSGLGVGCAIDLPDQRAAH